MSLRVIRRIRNTRPYTISRLTRIFFARFGITRHYLHYCVVVERTLGGTPTFSSRFMIRILFRNVSRLTENEYSFYATHGVEYFNAFVKTLPVWRSAEFLSYIS